MRKENAPAPVMLDDGAPYEKLGEDFRAVVIGLMQEYGSHSSMTWIACSPFQLMQFKQIVAKLFEICGPGGCWFLDGLGMESLDDLNNLNDISAPTLIEMLGTAWTAVPFEVREKMGLISSSEERRMLAA